MSDTASHSADAHAESVRTQLRALQEAYAKRDPKSASDFFARHFSQTVPAVIPGT